jgi:hypothetical protein
MNRQDDGISLPKILILVVWVIVVLSAYALVLALIMQYQSECIFRTWSMIFATIMGAAMGLLPLMLRRK